mmetsp:Transcript_80892/g.158058  ORF Transcript_80892/g.158058 Transcript_80892/m.158058 type:complete len:111 (-) Transcript_80892:1100-1432(-)
MFWFLWDFATEMASPSTTRAQAAVHVPALVRGHAVASLLAVLALLKLCLEVITLSAQVNVRVSLFEVGDFFQLYRAKLHVGVRSRSAESPMRDRPVKSLKVLDRTRSWPM